jgi:hypothetical protein
MDFHVLSVHTRDGDDGTPLQIISEAQLRHYRLAEAVAQAFGALVLGAVLAGAIVLICQSKLLVL